MNVGYVFVDHIRSQPIQLVDNRSNGLFIAWNEPGGKNDGVTLVYLYAFVLISGHSAQGAHGFSLAAGGNYHHLAVRKRFHFFFGNFKILGKMDKPVGPGNSHIGDHAFSIEDHFSAKLFRQGNDFLDSRDI